MQIMYVREKQIFRKRISSLDLGGVLCRMSSFVEVLWYRAGHHRVDL